jgi:hypothetical protein
LGLLTELVSSTLTLRIDTLVARTGGMLAIGWNVDIFTLIVTLARNDALKLPQISDAICHSVLNGQNWSGLVPNVVSSSSIS